MDRISGTTMYTSMWPFTPNTYPTSRFIFPSFFIFLLFESYPTPHRVSDDLFFPVHPGSAVSGTTNKDQQWLELQPDGRAELLNASSGSASKARGRTRVAHVKTLLL